MNLDEMSLHADRLSADPVLQREQAMAAILAQLRPGQQAMATWRGGELAVSAVPGAGKSTGMAAAAALTIAREQLNLRRYLVVVTFTRSAANNLKTKICANLKAMGLPPLGFTVNTLHGLALQIASRHRDRAGLDLDSQSLVSPNQGHRLIRTCVDRWIAENPRLYQQLLEGSSFDGEDAERLRRQSVLRTEVLPDLAHTVVREAKSSGLLPEQVQALAEGDWQGAFGERSGGVDWSLGGDRLEKGGATDRDRLALPRTAAFGPWTYDTLQVAAGLYRQYQRQLQSQDLIDYEDMILAALRVLEDPEICRFWQEQVFGVFEDEAQDSTPLQSQLLEILALNPDGSRNLVRVGDPNQAINSTFTPADPRFFQAFYQRCQRTGQVVTMDQAGRSTAAVIAAANFVVQWVNDWVLPPGYDRAALNHPTPPPPPPELLPFRLQQIRPVGPQDPQPDANPEPAGLGVELLRPADIGVTIALIRQRLGAIAAQEAEPQIAILVRENRQGQYLAEKLGDLEADLGLRLYEVGQQQRQSHVPQELWQLVQFLQRPHSPDLLKGALSVLVDRQRIPPQALDRLAIAPEQFLYPDSGQISLELSPEAQIAQRLCQQLLRSRQEIPLIDLLSFLASSLHYNQTELATADKLLDQVLQRLEGGRSLERLEAVLGEIISSERFEPVETEDPESLYVRRGQVTIITMHKAKGLDWDYVFVPFLHSNVIPGQSWVPTQMEFLGRFTLAEVARTQIRQGLHAHYGWSGLGLGKDGVMEIPGEVQAWEQAAYLKRSEEYRLLYVAMTRAKRLLWLSAAYKAPFSWGNPDKWDDREACPLITALETRRYQG